MPSVNSCFNDSVIDAYSFIHMLGKLKQRNKRNIWKKVKPRAFNNNSLMKLFLKLQNPQDIEKTINNYWINIWKETESQRYSQFSAQAYQTLRKILRYHLFEKRDGGIIIALEKKMTRLKTNQKKSMNYWQKL